MEKHIVKVLEAEYVTPDVKRFRTQKPAGYTFVPGQATDVALNLPGWEDQFRPFTFTSLNKWDYLEFTIRIYNNRNSVTEQLGKTNAGAELILQQPFGVLEYKGPGVFIAGGTGITPFISIFRDLEWQKKLRGCKLIYTNYGVQDVIYGEELHSMLKENMILHFSREGVIGFKERRLNRELLVEYIADFSQRFYICGSDSFVTAISEMLLELGASSEGLVIEK